MTDPSDLGHGKKKPSGRLTLPCLWCWGWDMSSVDFWKRAKIILIAAQNKMDPVSLADTAQLKYSQGKWRLIQDYVPFHDMFSQQNFHWKCLITYDTQRLIIFHGDSNTCHLLNFIFIIFIHFSFKLVLPSCCSSTFSLTSLFPSTVFSY